MKTLTYILIELMLLNGEPDVSSRLLEVSSENGKMVITKSEWGYLGYEPIEIKYEEDKQGLMVFSFVSKDDSPRIFVSEEPDELTYIESKVLHNGKERGSFILRKITDVSVDDPW